jgi:hypothetical protein
MTSPSPSTQHVQHKIEKLLIEQAKKKAYPGSLRQSLQARLQPE